ncbi:metalloregulator ArsR/SmtB family transcription factor [Paenibacillus profundus]|uniref:Metalloregulator ArsR/SmtB family transcription factor n=1 Tax=Paenibacillus profundus TaxID=1173085 RepID=A0ABS8YKI5_9BACL|nr:MULTISPECIES: metalloregulator ArsR/SmtB family transcription factor [Paenibacillus]MCE5171687.1 metalloregulator ArsR/SmtB family transcription factor [Paenibacillus profundus]
MEHMDHAEQKHTAIENVSAFLKLLGDPTRMTIVAILSRRECCVCELLEVFDVSQPSISQHLRKLKDANLVKEARKGQWIYYSLQPANPHYALLQEIVGRLPEPSVQLRTIEASQAANRCGNG